MNIITKAEWGSRRPNYPNPASHPMYGPKLGTTAHWEGPGIGRFPHSRCDRKVRAIERYHMVNRGWAGIAYSLLVCPHGYVFEGRGANTRCAANGSQYVNNRWYAVCYIGGRGDPFTNAARHAFRLAFGWLIVHGGAGDRRNGHRDHKATACPGDVIYGWVHSRASAPIQEDDMPTTREIRDEILNSPINVHDPNGRLETQSVTVREALTASMIELQHTGHEKTREWLSDARRSNA